MDGADTDIAAVMDSVADTAIVAGTAADIEAELVPAVMQAEVHMASAAVVDSTAAAAVGGFTVAAVADTDKA